MTTVVKRRSNGDYFAGIVGTILTPMFQWSRSRSDAHRFENRQHAEEVLRSCAPVCPLNFSDIWFVRLVSKK